MPEEKPFVALFEDNRQIPVDEAQLMAWCTNMGSWLEFIRMATNDGYAAQMTMQPVGKDDVPIKVIPSAARRYGSTFANPFAE